MHPGQTPSSRIPDLFRSGHKPLLCFFTAGVPDLPTTKEAIRIARSAGADLIELGVPFSEPVADGPTLQKATEIALRGGVTLEQILALVGELREEDPELILLLMGYAQPFHHYGIEKLAHESLALGVAGWILADVPIEEAPPFYLPLRERGGVYIPLVAPTTPPERVKGIVAECTPPFLYYVSVTGVTGAREAFPPGWERPLLEFRKVTTLPIVVGFGIAGAELARLAARVGDGVVVGSALMAPLIEEGRKGLSRVSRLVKEIRSVLP